MTWGVTKIQTFFEAPSNWQMEPLNESKFKIKTSGFTGDNKKEPDVALKTVLKASAHWKENVNPATRFRAVVKEAKQQAEKKVTQEESDQYKRSEPKMR